MGGPIEERRVAPIVKWLAATVNGSRREGQQRTQRSRHRDAGGSGFGAAMRSCNRKTGRSGYYIILIMGQSAWSGVWQCRSPGDGCAPAEGARKAHGRCEAFVEPQPLAGAVRPCRTSNRYKKEY